MRKIFTADTSLANTSAGGAESLLFREKNAIALCVDGYGADIIELPAIKNSREDYIINKTISERVKSARISIPAGDTPESAEEAFNSIKNARSRCLRVILPVSTVQMEYSYHLKNEGMIKKAVSIIERAAALCDFVEFTALDATGADSVFLAEICREAEKAGAKAVTLCDSSGASLPGELAELVKLIKNETGLLCFVDVNNSLGLANANAVMCISAGADGVKTSALGTDGLSTAVFADILRSRGADLGVCSSLDCTRVSSDIAIMKGFVSEPDFTFDTASDGADIYLDSDATISQVSKAVEALGYELTDEDTGKVFDALKTVLAKKNSVGKKELEALVASCAMQVRSTYHLESYIANCSNITTAMAHVTLKKEDEILNGVATGDGPIDASFKAIEQIIGHSYELDDFQIQSLTEGKESLGSTVVKLRDKGRLYSGNGISADIVGSAIRAYINALNKIVSEENR